MDNTIDTRDPSNSFLLFLSMLMLGGMPPETGTLESAKEEH